MAVFDLTPADAGRELANNGTITAIQVVARGVSGKFSLSDPATISSRGFTQPLILISTDYPAPILLSNANSNSTLQPQLNLIGAPIPYTTLVVDEVPVGGTWRVHT
jgi:hypothetical protein